MLDEKDEKLVRSFYIRIELTKHIFGIISAMTLGFQLSKILGARDSLSGSFSYEAIGIIVISIIGIVLPIVLWASVKRGVNGDEWQALLNRGGSKLRYLSYEAEESGDNNTRLAKQIRAVAEYYNVDLPNMKVITIVSIVVVMLITSSFCVGKRIYLNADKEDLVPKGKAAVVKAYDKAFADADFYVIELPASELKEGMPFILFYSEKDKSGKYDFETMDIDKTVTISMTQKGEIYGLDWSWPLNKDYSPEQNVNEMKEFYQKSLDIIRRSGNSMGRFENLDFDKLFEDYTAKYAEKASNEEYSYPEDPFEVIQLSSKFIIYFNTHMSSGPDYNSLNIEITDMDAQDKAFKESSNN